MSSVTGTSSHHANKQKPKNKLTKGQKGRVLPAGSILVNQGLKKIKLEEDFIPIKAEPNLTTEALNEDSDGNDMFTEEFTVTKEEPQTSVVSPEKLGQQGQSSSSCSCQEEVESLKNAVKRLTLKVEKQNEVITKMKTSLRKAVLSVMTCCQDDEDEDDTNRDGNCGGYENEELPVIDATSSKAFGGTATMAEDPLRIQNPESIAITQEEGESHQDNLQDSCSSNASVQSSGVPIPKSVSWNNSIESMEGFTNEDVAGGHIEQNVDEEDDSKETDNDGDGAIDKDVEKERRYKCHLCSKGFKSSSGIRRHTQNVHEGVRYKCAQCPGQFAEIRWLRKHQFTVHQNDRGRPTQMCGICGVHLLKSQRSLRLHMEHKHKDLVYTKTETIKPKPLRKTVRARIFQCQLCTVSFPKKGELSCHMSQVHGITSGNAEAEKMI